MGREGDVAPEIFFAECKTSHESTIRHRLSVLVELCYVRTTFFFVESRLRQLELAMGQIVDVFTDSYLIFLDRSPKHGSKKVCRL